MALDADIIDRIKAEFNDDASSAEALIRDSGKDGRIARCIVVASEGSVHRMRDLIRLADVDFRDVIVAGEYDGALRKVRDLRVSFLISSPNDFWIGEIAQTMNKHGYHLAELTSRPANVGPFDYTCDRYEGIATFSNGQNTIAIEKCDRRWSVCADGANLFPFGLDTAIDDEDRFRVQLVGYVSRK